MKEWTITLWRSNPQFKAGGYETTRSIMAKTEASALKKAEKQYANCAYGSMTVLRAELKK